MVRLKAPCTTSFWRRSVYAEDVQHRGMLGTLELCWPQQPTNGLMWEECRVAAGKCGAGLREAVALLVDFGICRACSPPTARQPPECVGRAVDVVAVVVVAVMTPSFLAPSRPGSVFLPQHPTSAPSLHCARTSLPTQKSVLFFFPFSFFRFFFFHGLSVRRVVSAEMFVETVSHFGMLEWLIREQKSNPNTFPLVPKVLRTSTPVAVILA